MKKLFTLLFVLVQFSSFAQTSLVKGSVFHDDTKLPYADVSIVLPKLKIATLSNENGEYSFSNVPYGEHVAIFSAVGEEDKTITINVTELVTKVTDVYLVHQDASAKPIDQDFSSVATEDANSDAENSVSSTGQSVSSALNAGRDAYQQAATFGWGQFFYRMRAYENDNNLVYLNGVPMNDLEEGGVFFNTWGGLNDVFRGRTTSLGLAPIDFNFGGLGLNTALDATASNQRKGTRITFSQTNRSYRSRIMLTHSSGLKKNGWAYSFSLSRRWANEGVIAGTYYSGLAYYGAIEKRWKKQGVNLMVVGSPLERGKAGPAQEVLYDLAGTNYYNPNWGWQNGKKRNTRVQKNNLPLIVLTHDADLAKNTKLNSSISYQFGETSQTGLNWFNARDPRPVYYRDLPIYDMAPDVRANVIKSYEENPDLLQVDWNQMYNANYNSVRYGNGQSIYWLGANVERTKRFTGSVNLESVLNDHVTIYSGLNVQTQNNHNYTRVEDLLGGGYALNLDGLIQSRIGLPNGANLNINDANPNKQVGDKIVNDYNIRFSKAAWFAQAAFVYNKFDFFVASELGYSSFFRTGNFRSALFPTTSFGNSSTNTFFNARTKGGVTYKINGRNYIYANGSIGNRAPFVDNVIISPRTRNDIISNPINEKVSSAEIGYLLRSPNVKARFTLYASQVRDAADIRRFFSDDDGSFVSMVLQGVNKQYSGLEFGADIKLSPSFRLNVAGSYAQAFYTSRPYLDVYADYQTVGRNGGQIGDRDTAYIKNYCVPSGPQSALQVALNYSSKRFWYANIAANYLARNYIDFTPNTRTKTATDPYEFGSENWHRMIDQSKLPNAFTVDINGGKSFKVNKYIKKADNNMLLRLNIGISNILNNTNIKLYGFENPRRERNLDWFPNRYAYALGAQYFVNLSLSF
jgi:hypothetical protein